VDRTGLGDTVLVAGSYEVTPPWQMGGWGRQVNMRTAPRGVRQPVTGSDPTRNWLCGLWEVFERLSGDVAFQAAHDLSGR
jgi:hypothetical protein